MFDESRQTASKYPSAYSIVGRNLLALTAIIIATVLMQISIVKFAELFDDSSSMVISVILAAATGILAGMICFGWICGSGASSDIVERMEHQHILNAKRKTLLYKSTVIFVQYGAAILTVAFLLVSTFVIVREGCMYIYQREHLVDLIVESDSYVVGNMFELQKLESGEYYETADCGDSFTVSIVKDNIARFETYSKSNVGIRYIDDLDNPVLVEYVKDTELSEDDLAESTNDYDFIGLLKSIDLDEAQQYVDDHYDSDRHAKPTRYEIQLPTSESAS